MFSLSWFPRNLLSSLFFLLSCLKDLKFLNEKAFIINSYNSTMIRQCCWYYFLFSRISLRISLWSGVKFLWLLHGYLRRWQSPDFQDMKFEYSNQICFTSYVVFTNFSSTWHVMNRELNSSLCTHLPLTNMCLNNKLSVCFKALTVLLLSGTSKLCAWFDTSTLVQYSFIDLSKLVAKLSTKQPNFVFCKKKNTEFE